jgi:5-methylcytosine-specific restriction endonuclease McrA
MIKLSPEETHNAKRMYRRLLELIDPLPTAIYKQLLILVNPARRNEISRAYYRRNRQKHNRLTSRWKQEHRPLVAAHASARRAKKRNTLRSLVEIEKIYVRAAELRQWFDVVVDHIIPLAKGGAHAPDNLQIIYAYENARKGTQLDYTPDIVFL